MLYDADKMKVVWRWWFVKCAIFVHSYYYIQGKRGEHIGPSNCWPRDKWSPVANFRAI